MRRLALLAAVVVLVAVGSAEARPNPTKPRPYLTREKAREMLNRENGYIKRCERRGPRHFHCLALFWFTLEEEEAGEWIAVDRWSELLVAEVRFRGVRIRCEGCHSVIEVELPTAEEGTTAAPETAP